MLKRGLFDYIKDFPSNIKGKFKSNLYAVKETELAQVKSEERKLIVKEKTVFDTIIMFISIALLLLFLQWMAISTQSKLYLVFVGFSPTVIYVILMVYLLEKNLSNKQLIWIPPIFLGFIFNFVGNYANLALLAKMQIYELTFINIFISYAFAGILSFIGIFDSVSHLYKKKVNTLKHEKKELEHQLEEFIEAGRVNKNNLTEYIQGIEDKCKAINFVIGRVYSNRNGGNRILRDRLKVHAKWYNDFSKISEDFNDKKKEDALILINMILERLNELWNKEKDLFESTCYELKNLKRNPNCNDKIINVLIANDNDPIRTYFESALDFCLKIKEFLES